MHVTILYYIILVPVLVYYYQPLAILCCIVLPAKASSLPTHTIQSFPRLVLQKKKYLWFPLPLPSPPPRSLKFTCSDITVLSSSVPFRSVPFRLQPLLLSLVTCPLSCTGLRHVWWKCGKGVYSRPSSFPLFLPVFCCQSVLICPRQLLAVCRVTTPPCPCLGAGQCCLLLFLMSALSLSLSSGIRSSQASRRK